MALSATIKISTLDKVKDKEHIVLGLSAYHTTVKSKQILKKPNVHVVHAYNYSLEIITKLLPIINKFTNVYIIGNSRYDRMDIFEAIKEYIPTVIMLDDMKPPYINWTVNTYFDLLTDVSKLNNVPMLLPNKQWENYGMDKIDHIKELIGYMTPSLIKDEVTAWLNQIIVVYNSKHDTCPLCGSIKYIHSEVCKKCNSESELCICGKRNYTDNVYCGRCDINTFSDNEIVEYLENKVDNSDMLIDKLISNITNLSYKQNIILTFNGSGVPSKEIAKNFINKVFVINIRNIGVSKLKLLFPYISLFDNVYVHGNIRYSKQYKLELLENTFPSLKRLGPIKDNYIIWSIDKYSVDLTKLGKDLGIDVSITRKWRQFNRATIDSVITIINSMDESEYKDELDAWVAYMEDIFYEKNEKCTLCDTWKKVDDTICSNCKNEVRNIEMNTKKYYKCKICKFTKGLGPEKLKRKVDINGKCFYCRWSEYAW